jgi:Flp pilus assembly protein TadG
MTLCLIPLIGALGMGTEVSGWWLLQRHLQNAADTAALAAATTNDTTSNPPSCSSNPGTYACEAKAAAAGYGLTDGSSNVTVTPAYLTTGCPGGASVSTCYQVTVSKKVPLYLVGVVGYHGDTTIGSAYAQTVSAVAYARKGVNPRTYCVTSLVQGDGSNVTDTTTLGITANGNPAAVPQGCPMFSDGSTRCTAGGNHPLADYVDAVGASDPNCAKDLASGGSTPVTDTNYRALASNIQPLPTTCSGAGISGDTASGYTIASSLTLPSSCSFVGNVTLSRNATVVVNTPATASGGSVIYIKNGTLDLNGGTLQTAKDSGLTIVFTGSPMTTASPFGTKGTLDIAAPTGGTWKGVAIYYDPSMSAANLTVAGSQTTWDITGLIYAPNSDITLSGSVSKSSNGYQCISIVDRTFQENGAVSIFDNPLAQCSQAGLTPPMSSKPEAIGLVQ